MLHRRFPTDRLVVIETDGAAPDRVGVRQQLTYTLTVTNNGPSTATGVVVTDTLPAEVSCVSTVSSQSSCSGPSGVTCELRTISNGATATVTIVTIVVSGN